MKRIKILLALFLVVAITNIHAQTERPVWSKQKANAKRRRAAWPTKESQLDRLPKHFHVSALAFQDPSKISDPSTCCLFSCCIYAMSWQLLLGASPHAPRLSA